MQAFILTCLLCLQTQFPCDPNQSPPSLQDPSCSQCLTGLTDHFNLTNSSDMGQALQGNLTEPSGLVQGSVPADIKENLEDLVADMLAIVQDMKGDPDDIYEMINKVKNEMNQGLVASAPDNNGNLISTPGQHGSLQKILERFDGFVDEGDALERKLTIMQEVVSNGEVGKRRDTLRKGDRLVIGESLFSENGKYQWNIELGTADWVIYDENGSEVKRLSMSGLFWKPIGSNINVAMNQSLEISWDIWQGKSANKVTSYGPPRPCAYQYADCYTRLDNDGHLKLFTSYGEAVETFM